MSAAARVLLVTTMLLLAACDRPAIQPRESLVGAKQLPSQKELSRESISVGLGRSDWGQLDPGNLIYELLPDDKLTVTHSKYEVGEEIIGSETFPLSSRVASQIRRDLRRLRPERLGGLEWEVKPIGCRTDVSDDFPDISVGFIAEGPKPGVDDDPIGLFSLPATSSCNNRHAQEARRLLNRVIARFPRSKVASEWQRRMERVEAELAS